MEDEFELAFADELELLQDENDVLPSHRTLTPDRPYPHSEIVASRKRTLEEGPLHLTPSDSHKQLRKIQRLTGSESSTTFTQEYTSQDREEEEELSLHTSGSAGIYHSNGRREDGVLRGKDKGQTKHQDKGSPKGGYSPPSPYSPPSSPFSLHSPTSPVPSHDHTSPAVRSKSLNSPPTSSNSRLRNSVTPKSRKRLLDSTTPSELDFHTCRDGESHNVSPISKKRLLDSAPSNSNFDRKLESNLDDSDDDLLEKAEETLENLRKARSSCSNPCSDVFNHDDDDSDMPTSDANFSQISPSGSRLRQTSSHIHVLSRAPACPHLSVTSSEGHRVYLRLRETNDPTRARKMAQAHSHSRKQLLKIPFTELKASVEEERRRYLIEQSDDILQALTSPHEADDYEDAQVLLEDPDDERAGGKIKEAEDMLWVDKYSPRYYTELLSDDGINRTILSWLRLWDEVVFGCPAPLKNMASGGGTGEKLKKDRNSKDGTAPKGKKFEKKKEFQNPDLLASVEALDETKRPKLKLALLCGSPGLGKTTLAHIIAKHAGYNVVEMNASDDRSPEVFKQKIEASTQMKAVLALDNKPNCLIIDEIDGAPTAAINILVDLVKQKEQGKKKGKHGSNMLSRPIICICNDQYAPSLRQLRQHSLILYFPATVTSRLATRLQQVAKKEGLKAAMSTLLALCEKTDNDIRACLNSLQFMGRKHKDITLALVQSANVGQKDAQRSLFSLWKEVFQLPTSKKHTLNQGPLRITPQSGTAGSREPNVMSSNSVRFHNILLAASATGEYSKVTNGLFENYLLVKFRDPNLEAVSLGQDWMVFNDILRQHISCNQDYAFNAYLPFLSVAFHFLFAVSSKPQLKYPNTNYEMMLKEQQSSHLLTSLMLEMPPSIKRTISHSLLTVEILPFLSDIISPSFRPVSTQLYSSSEKQQFADLVGTMISYSLTYSQERGPDGQYSYILDPNIEEISRFPGLPQKKQLTYSAKQLIAREVGVEKLRRAEQILTSKNLSSDKGEQAKKTAGIGIKEKKVDHQKEKLKKSFIPVVKDVPDDVDFFGRKISSKAGLAKKNQQRHSHPLWFKFNEGFSNAVRRPIHIKDFL